MRDTSVGYGIKIDHLAEIKRKRDRTIFIIETITALINNTWVLSLPASSSMDIIRGYQQVIYGC